MVIPWRRVAVGGAVIAAATIAGWWWWRARLPRPDLLEFVPADAMAVIQIREGKAALAALRSIDHAGVVAGERGAINLLLRGIAGPDVTVDRIAEFARDEGMCVLLPQGDFLAACRLGARERLADRFIAGTRLVRRQRVAGGVIRLARLPGGARIAYTIARGTVLVSGNADRLAGVLGRPSGRSESPVAAAAGSLPPAFRIRLAAAAGRGEVDRLAVALGAGSSGATLEARLLLKSGGPWAGWAEAVAAAGATAPGRVWAAVPAGSLVAVALARLAWLDAMPAPWHGLLARLPVALPAGEADRPAALALLSVDHRGVVPMPQLGVVIAGGAPGFDAAWDRAVDRALKNSSSGDLAVSRTAAGGLAAAYVTFPVTRTLAPAWAMAGDDALFGSSLAALTVLADAAAGRAPSAPRAPAAPVEFTADLSGLAAEAGAIVEGLRSAGLLDPAADARWAREVRPWVDVAAAMGRMRAGLRFEPGAVALTGEIRVR